MSQRFLKRKSVVRLKSRQLVALLAEKSARTHENSAAYRINTGIAVEESGAGDRICALNNA